jgi:hypothetical protein
VTSEGVLGGLADPRATLRASPRRDPTRATFGGLPPESPGDRSDRCQRRDAETAAFAANRYVFLHVGYDANCAIPPILD